MAKYDGVLLKIDNWEQYNPRGDSKYPSWWRCQNNFFFSPTFSELDPEEVCAVIFLMCEVSRKNGSSYRIKTSYMARSARVPQNKVTSALDKLRAEGFWSETRATSPDPERPHPNSPTTNVRTDETNEHNVPDPAGARETRNVDQDQDTGAGPGPGAGIGLRPGEAGTGSGSWERAPLDFAAPELVAAAINEALSLEPTPEPPTPPPAAPAAVVAADPPPPARPAPPDNVIVGRFPAQAHSEATPKRHASEPPPQTPPAAPERRVIPPVRPAAAVAPPGKHRARGYFVASDYDGPPTVEPCDAIRRQLGMALRRPVTHEPLEASA